jgi:hypothetical protein
MAADATVEESAMLTDRVTGQEREVDVVIRGNTGGHAIVVGVEATSKGRPATVEWVEQMVGKHANLPTDKLVLVAEAGFTATARERAEAAGAVALAPEDIAEGDPAFVIVNRLRTLWPKFVSFAPEKIGLRVLRSGDSPPYQAPTLADFPVYLDDGQELGTLEGVIRNIIGGNFGTVAKQIGLADIDEDLDRFFVLQIAPFEVEVDGVKRGVFVRVEDVDPPELRPIDMVEVRGRAEIRVSEIPLKHGRLGDTLYSFGKGKVQEQDTLVVVTENEEGGKLTFRPHAAGSDKAAQRKQEPGG